MNSDWSLLRRPLTVAEALRVAETQAAKLLRLSEVDEAPVPELVISSLPRVQVDAAGHQRLCSW